MTGDGPASREVTCVIVGTGFSGLGAAIALRRAGVRDLVIRERAGDVGGTWRDNTYPAAGATSSPACTRSPSRPGRPGARPSRPSPSCAPTSRT